MAFYQFYREQKLLATIDEVWDFISSPQNLKLITPSSMKFDITSKNCPSKMYAGMIISYKVSPFRWLTTNWVTEITQVNPKKFFIDEQRIGPYKLWHHQHILEELDNGVLMKDIITYQPPFGFLGAIANKFIIRKKLNRIFEYRKKVLDAKYNNNTYQSDILCVPADA